jgi:hypothetical protein
MKVRNIDGTSGLSCACGSWLDHWKKFSSQTANYCSEKTCVIKVDLVGAHVQKADISDNRWYIIPLCKKHNAKATELEIIDERVFVLANANNTCGK